MGVQDCAAAEAAMELDELDRGVVHALQIHPRAPWTLVGEVLGVNPVTAARRWHRLEEAGLDDVEETSRVLAGVREVRSCAITAGPHNLVIDVRLRDLRDVHAFEAHLSRRLPRLTVADRSVVLRTVKHMGHLLDRDGRCTGVVPLRHPQGPRSAAVERATGQVLQGGPA
ncbi:Lrp/AsnC family transcriptional regulator [Streptomyces sp. NPDC058086]|uniref:Lrp/AsnC family transcriptional regulator n=1 Tax=Streptomyces sp. NPDC058086 TaxID=3346334 RepID=UPI0036E06780